MGPSADQVRGAGPVVEYVHLLVALLFVRLTARERWAEVSARAQAAAVEKTGPAARRIGTDLLEHIDRVLDGEAQRLGSLPHSTALLSHLTPASGRDLAEPHEGIQTDGQAVRALDHDRRCLVTPLGWGE